MKWSKFKKEQDKFWKEFREKSEEKKDNFNRKWGFGGNMYEKAGGLSFEDRQAKYEELGLDNKIWEEIYNQTGHVPEDYEEAQRYYIGLSRDTKNYLASGNYNTQQAQSQSYNPSQQSSQYTAPSSSTSMAGNRARVDTATNVQQIKVQQQQQAAEEAERARLSNQAVLKPDDRTALQVEQDRGYTNQVMNAKQVYEGLTGTKVDNWTPDDMNRLQAQFDLFNAKAKGLATVAGGVMGAGILGATRFAANTALGMGTDAAVSQGIRHFAPGLSDTPLETVVQMGASLLTPGIKTPSTRLNATYYHGGKPKGSTLADIDLFKPITKQQGKGSGFYMYGKDNRSTAERYGLKEKSVHKFDISDDAKIGKHDGNIMSVSP